MGLLKGGDFLRSDWVPEDTLNYILAALTPPNRLAIITSMATGLRIDDVLHLKTYLLNKDRFTIKEMKTGKSKRVRLPNDLKAQLLAHAGRFYVFENRTDQTKPRTRQAVYKDLKRACKAFRVSGVNVSPHTARKIYSVNAYRRTGSLARVQDLLNHSSEAVTLLYAMADELTARHTAKKKVNVPVTQSANRPRS